MDRSPKVQNNLLLVALSVETLSATIGIRATGWAPASAILYLLSGLSLVWLIVQHPVSLQTGPRQMVNFSRTSLASWGLVILTGLVMVFASRNILRATPIAISNADMLPVIRVLNERMVHGQWHAVYNPVPEIWNGTRPIYLPGLWLPFAPAVVLHFDMRWITVTALWFSVALFFLLSSGIRIPSFRYIVLGLGIVLAGWLITADEFHGVISMSEEPVVIFYYVLLVIALASRRPFAIACAALLCLLSRYALIGWIPAYSFYLLVRRRYKAFRTLLFTGIAGLFLFFILPFGWQNFLQLLQLPDKYVDFSMRVWKDSPDVFSDGLGMARYFMPAHPWWLHGTLVVGSFLLPFAFVSTCLYSGRRLNLENIPAAALKLSLVVFFNFIDVPYLYLFYTSSFVSLLTVAFLLRGNDPAAEAIQAC